jgi:hypothetical protein
MQRDVFVERKIKVISRRKIIFIASSSSVVLCCTNRFEFSALDFFGGNSKVVLNLEQQQKT